jgi:hypothetical protein
LKLEVPGIEEKDLDVRVENNTLTVKGERKFEKEEKEENFHRIERRYGSFYRAFTLPSTVDTEHIAANYTAGRAEAGTEQEGRSAAQADQDQRGRRQGGRSGVGRSAVSNRQITDDRWQKNPPSGAAVCHLCYFRQSTADCHL